MTKKILFLVLLFTMSCGYEPIYLKKNSKELLFNEITLIGNTEINDKLINSLIIKKRENDNLNNEIVLKSQLKEEEVSKDSKGKVTSYRSTINVELEVLENNQTTKSKNFMQTFTYSNKDNKFELIEHQIKIKNLILNKIIEEISLYLNLR